MGPNSHSKSADFREASDKSGAKNSGKRQNVHFKFKDEQSLPFIHFVKRNEGTRKRI